MIVTQTLEEKIKQRRSQMLVHSYLYYWLDESIVSDYQWQAWADDLVELQKDFEGDLDFYDEAFYDWDGSTGCHLPKDEWVVNAALWLFRIHYSKKVQVTKTY